MTLSSDLLLYQAWYQTRVLDETIHNIIPKTARRKTLKISAAMPSTSFSQTMTHLLVVLLTVVLCIYFMARPVSTHRTTAYIVQIRAAATPAVVFVGISIHTRLLEVRGAFKRVFTWLSGIYSRLCRKLLASGGPSAGGLSACRAQHALRRLLRCAKQTHDP